MRYFPWLGDLSYGVVEAVVGEVGFDEVAAGGGGEDCGLAAAEELGDAEGVVLGVLLVRWGVWMGMGMGVSLDGDEVGTNRSGNG